MTTIFTAKSLVPYIYYHHYNNIRLYKDQFHVIRYWFNRRLDFDYQIFKSECKYPSATKKQIMKQ